MGALLLFILSLPKPVKSRQRQRYGGTSMQETLSVLGLTEVWDFDLLLI